MFTKYDKFITAVVGMVVTILIHFFGEQSDVVFVAQAVVGLLTVLGVYLIPNKPLADG